MNWKNIIQELIDAGLSQAEIAIELGIKPPSVNEIYRSTERKDIRWTTGDRLLSLHRRVMRKTRKAA